MASTGPTTSDPLSLSSNTPKQPSEHPMGHGPPVDSPAAAHKFSTRILNAGFVFALVLAAVCLVSSALYLYTFLSTTMFKIDALLARAGTPGVSEVLIQLGINAALVSARMALLSCGVFVAMSFGFLGFGLFLIGVKGDIEASGTTETFGLKVARMSPGVFVMTGTLILVGICVTHRTPFDYRLEQPAATPASGEKAAESVLKRLAASGPGPLPGTPAAPAVVPAAPATPTTHPTLAAKKPDSPAGTSAQKAAPSPASPSPSKSEPAPPRSEYDDQLPIIR